MKILVTGGAGYIGSVTTELLLDAGHDVTVFDNLERGHRAAVDPRARFIEGDLRQAASIVAAMGDVKPDAVMHFAAFALVGESMEQPELYFRNNVVGGINLADAMLKHEVGRIVFSSTCATYGQPERVPITEDEKQKPTNPYGESKLMFEQTLKWHRELHGMKTIFLRYFNACGATVKFGEDHTPETHIIPIVLQAALGKRKKVFIYGDDYETPDGTCVRDYVHVADLAEAHIAALEALPVVQGSFNLGTGAGDSVRTVLDAVETITGRRLLRETAARRAGDPPVLVASNQRAGENLGWRPRRSLTDAVSDAWAWMLAHPDGYADRSR